MTILANITGAAAELLMSAYENGEIGTELGGFFTLDVATELEAEGFGDVATECERHGQVRCPVSDDCTAEVYPVFLINDAGTAWLDDAGKI